MSSQIKKFTLAAAAVLTLGYLVGCGTRGENTGFGDTARGPVLSGSSSSSSSSGSSGGGLTGGATGSATVNDAFPITAATGLTISNMLATSGGSGNSNPPTRLAFGTFSSLGTRRVLAVQGLGVAAAGRVVIMPRNPEAPAGPSNVVLDPSGTGSDASTKSLNNPFGILVEGETVFITDNSTTLNAGRLFMYDQITATGVCRAQQILTTPPLSSPVDMVKDGDFLYVAENAPRGGGGQIRKIDLTKPLTDATNSVVIVQNVNNPVSIALDKSSGRRLLYISENGAGSASGAQGGIARVDLSVGLFATTGDSLTTTALGSTATTGVTFIAPGTGGAFNFPFDLAVDAFGNVVTTEGVSVVSTGLVSPNFQAGKIRVIPGATPANTAITVLQNAAPGSTVAVTGSRGVSLNPEDGTGTVVSAFFTEGAALTTTTRQLTFRTTDGAIFRHLQLDSGKPFPLDTLWDPGDAGLTPPVAPNLKYTVGAFNGGTLGQILDIR